MMGKNDIRIRKLLNTKFSFEPNNYGFMFNFPESQLMKVGSKVVNISHEFNNEKQEIIEPNIFIHLPFCDNRCSYCIFSTILDSDEKTNYIQALKVELNYWRERLKGTTVKSLYIGGGSTLLNIDIIKEILNVSNDFFSIDENTEITIETSPSSIIKSEQTLAGLINEFKIDRISIGIQSFSKEILRSMNRIKEWQYNQKAINILNKFIDDKGNSLRTYNIDIISSIQNRDIKYDLNLIRKLNVPSVTIYNLETNTEISFLKENRSLTLSNFIIENNEIENFFKKNGYSQNVYGWFAKDENSSYRAQLSKYHMGSYIGIGVKAYGFLNINHKYYFFYRNLDCYRNDDTFCAENKNCQNKITLEEEIKHYIKEPLNVHLYEYPEDIALFRRFLFGLKLLGGVELIEEEYNKIKAYVDILNSKVPKGNLLITVNNQNDEYLRIKINNEYKPLTIPIIEELIKYLPINRSFDKFINKKFDTDKELKYKLKNVVYNYCRNEDVNELFTGFLWNNYWKHLSFLVNKRLLAFVPLYKPFYSNQEAFEWSVINLKRYSDTPEFISRQLHQECIKEVPSEKRLFEFLKSKQILLWEASYFLNDERAYNNCSFLFYETEDANKFCSKVLLNGNKISKIESSTTLYNPEEYKQAILANWKIAAKGTVSKGLINQVFVYYLLQDDIENKDFFTGIILYSLDKLLYEDINTIYFEVNTHLINLILREKEFYSKLYATRAANISILVDSFAHNVAAHSLTALSNYFAKRKNELETKDISQDLEYNAAEKTVLAKFEIEKISIKAETEYKILTGLDYTKEQRGTISISDIIRLGEKDLLVKLFQLKQLNKNSSDISLPVPIDDSVYSYIDYLSGKSEFWSAVISGESFNNSISNLFDLIWDFVNNPLFVGTLAGSEKINKIKFIINEKPFAFVDFSAINDNNLDGNYQFVQTLDNFEEEKNYLLAKEVLLPGSNVGKQSVYTIFENCLRNIKHYDISNPQVDEVEFHLNIKETNDNKQFIFEIYLGLTKYLNKKSSDDVIREILEQIKKGTYDKENSQPIFGGTSQSILCASHLVTGRFSDEEKENGERQFNAIYDEDFVKYTFNLWKGEKIKPLVEDTIIEKNDNISRYKFIAVPPNMDITQIRNNIQDAIRIIQTSTSDYEEVYKDWLSYWLPNVNHECNLVNTNPIIIKFKEKTLQFDHAGTSAKNNLLFRSHGIFKRDIEKKWDELKYDVAEAMLTGIYTIDNRLFNVFSQKEESFQRTIEDKLNLFVKEENPASLNCSNILVIDNENNIICDKINFLIIHLSFIESLNPEYKNNINNFIKKIQEATNNRDNFHLIITTGRGRTEWKKSIKEEYRHFVKHRSVLSLQNAIIDGVMKGDDFNLKYNIIKVLLGS